MYKEYMRERQLCEFIEDDKSFITYSINDNVCYLQDMYIINEFRQNGLSSILVKKLEDIARENKCEYLVTSINLSQKGNNIINQKTAKRNGFIEKVRDVDGIYYLKEL